MVLFTLKKRTFLNNRFHHCSYCMFGVCLTSALAMFLYIHTSGLTFPFDVRSIWSSNPSEFYQVLKEHNARQLANPTVLSHACHKLKGRLGNAMFQFAAVYGIAKFLGKTPVFDTLRGLDEMFYLSESVKTNLLCDNSLEIKERKSCSFDKRFNNDDLRGDINITVTGFLQSWHYFYTSYKDIRRQFTFRSHITANASETLKSALIKKYGDSVIGAIANHSRILVGVHVRRGDQLNAPQKKFGFRVPDKTFVPRAQNYFRNKYPNATFIVASDDFNWTKSATDDRGDVIFMEGNSAIVDMCILTMTNHTVVTIGTFGWWSAWLTNGTTVYWKDFASPNSKLGKEYSRDRRDHLLPTWIGLS